MTDQLFELMDKFVTREVRQFDEEGEKQRWIVIYTFSETTLSSLLLVSLR